MLLNRFENDITYWHYVDYVWKSVSQGRSLLIIQRVQYFPLNRLINSHNMLNYSLSVYPIWILGWYINLTEYSQHSSVCSFSIDQHVIYYCSFKYCVKLPLFLITRVIPYWQSDICIWRHYIGDYFISIPVNI